MSQITQKDMEEFLLKISGQLKYISGQLKWRDSTVVNALHTADSF